MQNHVIVVTGAARSIGAAIAETLAEGAAGVLVHYHGRQAEAEAVVGRIAARGVDAIAVQAELREPGAAERLIDAADKRWARVANAGMPNPGVDVLHGTDEDFEAVVATTPLRFIRCCALQPTR